MHHVFKRLPEFFERGTDNGLSEMFKELLEQHYKNLEELQKHLDFYTQKIKEYSKSDECTKLQENPGFGPIVATAFYQHVGNGCDYRNGRCVSASIGLVPGQSSSGGKDKLLGISKRGDSYLRTLLVHGARAVVSANKDRNTPLANWIRRIVSQRGYNKAVVAMANKMARIGWAVLKSENRYQADYAA